VLPAHVADTVGGVGCRRAFVLRVARVHAPPADRPGTPPFGAPDERHRARLSSSRVDDGRWLDHPTALPMPFTQVIPDPHVQSPLARGGQIVVPAPGPASRGRPRVCRSSRSALSARSGCSPFGGIAPPPMPGRGRRPSPAATAATAAALVTARLSSRRHRPSIRITAEAPRGSRYHARAGCGVNGAGGSSSGGTAPGPAGARAVKATFCPPGGHAAGAPPMAGSLARARPPASGRVSRETAPGQSEPPEEGAPAVRGEGAGTPRHKRPLWKKQVLGPAGT